jgi:hypothetical protein
VNKESLSHYCDNAIDGLQKAYAFDWLKAVKYPKGWRDILIFVCLKEDNSPKMDIDGNFRFAGIIMNSNEGKSGKAKQNKIKRYLLKKKDNISLFESWRSLPPMDYFLREVPIDVMVTNKTVNNKTVSNVTSIYSELYEKRMFVKQKFDGLKIADLT